MSAPDDPLSFWKLIYAAGAALLGFLTWLGKRLVDRMDNHELRLQTIERALPTMATKADIAQLTDRLQELGVSVNSEIAETRSQLSDQYAKILEMLLAQQRRGQ